MDLKGKVNLSSSWEESASLQSVLYINSSCDELQPLHGAEPVLVHLSRPTASEENLVLCFLHIRHLMALPGYSVRGVEFTSGSRTVEVYEGEDYIATCKGSVVGPTSQEMYQWHLDLASEGHSYDSLTLKLLSLRGRSDVAIRRLTLILAGHRETSSRCEKLDSCPQPLQEALASLPISVNTPPFLSNLVSSLKCCPDSKAVITSSSETGLKLLPPEIAHMVSAFQALRRPVAEPPIPTQDGNRGECQEGTEDQNNGMEDLMGALEDPRCNPAPLTLADVQCLVDERMRELEIRMKNYVDARFKEMMNCIVRASRAEDSSEQAS